VAAAFEALCLTARAPAQLVSAAKRILAQQHHPDLAGGDLPRMQLINHSADLAPQWLAERERSASEDGQGGRTPSAGGAKRRGSASSTSAAS